MKYIKCVALVVILIVAIIVFYVVYKANSKVKSQSDCPTCEIQQSK
jgi:hypothetical protein